MQQGDEVQDRQGRLAKLTYVSACLVKARYRSGRDVALHPALAEERFKVLAPRVKVQCQSEKCGMTSMVHHRVGQLLCGYCSRLAKPVALELET